MSFSKLIADMINNGVAYRIKHTVYVKRKMGRDSNGRFNGKNRKAYSYHIYDLNNPATFKLLLAENIMAKNELLSRLQSKNLT